MARSNQQVPLSWKYDVIDACMSRVLAGLGSALYVTCAIGWLARISHGRDRIKMMSVYSSLVFMGMGTGPAVGGFVATYYGIQAPFYVYALLTTVGVVVTIPLHEPILENDVCTRGRWSDLKTVFSNRSFILVNFSVLALFFLRSSVRSTFLPLYVSINLGLGEGQIGLLMTAAMIATGLVSLPSGWLSDRVGRKTPMMTYIFSSTFFVLLVPFQNSMEALLMFMVAYGFATGLQGSILAWSADVTPLDKLGTAMGVYRFIGDLGFFLGPITVTYASDYFDSNLITFHPFLIPAIITAIGGITLIKADDPSRHHQTTYNKAGKGEGKSTNPNRITKKIVNVRRPNRSGCSDLSYS